MFAQWWGDVQVQSVIFVQRFVSGTGRGFGKAPLQKHKRFRTRHNHLKLLIYNQHQLGI